jgi:hypothetical protein
MQLGHTFPHQVDKKKREEIQSSSFRRRVIEAVIFSRLALLLKRLFIPHGTCISLQLSFISSPTSNLHEMSPIFSETAC